jgi:large subunit ribosomal protein L4
MPRKQRRLALRGALSAKSIAGELRVVEEIVLEAPRTSSMAALFEQLGAGARTLFVLPEHDLMLEKSTSNLPFVKLVLAGNLNVEDLVAADTVVFTREALGQLEGWLS